ncbi:formimidoylglutamate deiminase [Pseudochryseolinea flava]|uniref:Formimidoylglutamate deiminase n=1 Tax=Pseudochryseolinea flava TaxID=2059302 RepID=A0A364Y8W3_9BACT|nr:formimidoylglutamate deiminase [Pseudochryseolinea flava]
MKKYYSFDSLLLSTGWLSPGYVGVDGVGTIQYLSDKSPVDSVAIESIHGFALPGFRNAHSHAFQFGMAGMAEKHRPGTNDDFWSWREAMYRCALSLDPTAVEHIAAMLYAELLKKGYTHVAEFQYLHHDKDGKPYANYAEMGERLVAAAETAGIRITLIPVFYQQGNFGKEPFPEQRRFISKTIDEYFQLLDDSAHVVAHAPHARLGFSVHSLRAVKPNDVVRTFEQGPSTIPFHLHAAEQKKEVADCFLFHKQTPIEWLLNNLPVNERFHIVHCTHLTDHEVAALAKSRAHVVLCPGTEGNLGDGIFRLTDFASQGGQWSIGTDSHISLNPLEDLRWLDYAQRFTTHKRNTFDDGAAILVDKTFHAGNSAMGFSSSEYFSVGQKLDAVIYDAHRPLLSQARREHLLSAIIYTASPAEILGTMIDGKWIVKNNYHFREGEIFKSFTSTHAK